MKSGKYVQLDSRDNIIISYGSVNSKQLKSIYLRHQCWVQPKSDDENWNRVISDLRREIKLCVMGHLNRDFFKEHYIVDLDLRSSGILPGKRSFFSCEITLFTKRQMDIKSEQFSHLMQEFSHKIIKNSTSLFRNFTVSQRKR